MNVKVEPVGGNIQTGLLRNLGDYFLAEISADKDPRVLYVTSRKFWNCAISVYRAPDERKRRLALEGDLQPSRELAQELEARGIYRASISKRVGGDDNLVIFVPMVSKSNDSAKRKGSRRTSKKNCRKA